MAFRVSGSGREDDHFSPLAILMLDRSAIQDRNLVETSKQVLEVTGEGVLVIKEQDHARRSSKARALILFSLYS